MAKKPVKKTKTAKSTKKESTDRNAMAAELRGLIPRLDEEGLVYLVEQARIHLYNMQVDEHNRAVIAAAGSHTTSSGKPSSAKTGKAGKKPVRKNPALQALPSKARKAGPAITFTTVMPA